MFVWVGQWEVPFSLSTYNWFSFLCVKAFLKVVQLVSLWDFTSCGNPTQDQICLSYKSKQRCANIRSNKGCLSFFYQLYWIRWICLCKIQKLPLLRIFNNFIDSVLTFIHLICRYIISYLIAKKPYLCLCSVFRSGSFAAVQTWVRFFPAPTLTTI